MKSTKSQIIIAEDHALVREGLKRIISLADDITVVGEAVNGWEVLEKLQKHPCQVLTLDMSMPGICGIELIKRIKQERPMLPILVLSICDDCHLALRALKAGAAGYATKDSAPDMLIAAIRKVAGGGRYVEPQLAEHMALEFGLSDDRPAHEKLSERELQVLHLLMTGKHIKEIALGLSLSAKTVSTHKSRAMDKLGVQNNADLIRYGIKHNLFEPSDVAHQT
jgi:DNA-binding NarL/FixJ family response regulator